MKKLTVNQILSLNPCYSEEKIRALAGSKNEWSALDIINLNIPNNDKLWLILREDFVDADVLHEFTCRCVDIIKVKKQQLREKLLTTNPAWLAAFAAGAVQSTAKSAAQSTAESEWEVEAAVWEATAQQIEILRELLEKRTSRSKEENPEVINETEA